jgi:protein Mpv17
MIRIGTRHFFPSAARPKFPCSDLYLRKRPNRPRYFSSSEKHAGGGPSLRTSPLQWYSHKLDTHPIVTKCISAGIIASLGNLGAQRLMYNPTQGGEFQVDYSQMGRFALLNVGFVAPVLHFWYVGLARAIPGTELWPVIKRVFFDEFVFTPAYIPVLMGILWTLEGVEPKNLPRMIQEEWLNILIFDWSVYIPVQFVNFRFVPVKYQVLVINIVGVGWNCFVSWRAQGQQAKQQEIKEDKL